jgi:surface protein
MSGMFSNATAFNQNIGNWNTGNVTNMSGMFESATSFSQDIVNWNTGNVTNMEYMFGNATSFNQPIGNWNIGNVTNMESMFGNATSFNQDIGNWTLNANVNMQFMFNFGGMSCESYDNTLTGWNDNPSTPNNRNLGAQGLIYWQGQTARNNLITNKGWTITGDAYNQCNYMPTCLTYTWTGGAGLWNDPLKWNSGFVPTTCNNVILIPYSDVTVPGGYEGFAKSVINEGQLTVETAGILTVVGWQDNDLPIIDTHPVANITATGAMSGGYIFSEGSSAITARGIVWSTTTGPDINIHEGITIDGTGLGVYHSTITGLMGNTTYYVRAYATNAFGTAYGEELSFMTL